MLSVLPLLLSTALLPESPRWLLFCSQCSGGDAIILRDALVATKDLGVEDAALRIAALKLSARQGGQDTVQPVEPWERSSNELVALWDMKHKASGYPLLLTPERMAARPKEGAPGAQGVSVLKILRRTLRNI